MLLPTFQGGGVRAQTRRKLKSLLGDIDMPDELGGRNNGQTFLWPFGHGRKLQASPTRPLVLGEAVPQQLTLLSRPLTASIVTAVAEIHDLSAFVRTLVPEPGMLAPRFFLASLLPRSFRPCVVVVSEGRRIVGLLYAQERLMAGIPTGIVLGDDTLGTMLVAHPDDAESVLQCALQTLLKLKAALRFRVGSARLALLQAEAAKANAEILSRREVHHAHLELPRTYDEFLASVGRYTRHNFSRYRRRSESAGNEFCPDQPFTDFCAAAKLLFPKEAYAKQKSNFRQSLAMIEAMPSRLLIGLRRSSGEWISLAGGWYVGDLAVLNMQLNNRTCARESISLVLRSYLLEQLIRRGIREVIFWAGTSAPLNSYITKREEYMTYLDSRSLSWRLVRRSCITLAKLAPTTFGKWLKWEVPNSNGKLGA